MRFLLFTLIILHVLLLIKLNFFTSLISGETVLLDFDTYYKLTTASLSGTNPYSVYDIMQTPAPPLIFLYFSPFTLVPLSIARTLTTVINLFSGYLASYLLARNFYPKKKMVAFLAIATILFSSFPARLSLQQGQPILFLTLFLVLAATQKNRLIKGLALAGGIVMRVFFALVALSYLKNDRKTFTLIAGGVVGAFVITLLFMHPAWYSDYLFGKFTEVTFSSEGITGLDYYSQSLRSTLNRLLLGQLYLPFFFLAAAVAARVVFLTGSLELAILLSIILSPVSWQHYFVMLSPVFVKLFATMPKSFVNGLLFTSALAFSWIELPWLHNAQPHLFNALLASHYFLSGLLLLLLLALNRKALTKLKKDRGKKTTNAIGTSKNKSLG